MSIFKRPYWKVFNGWEGNHDKRVEAECSICGYQPETVYNIADLPKYCPNCGKIKRIKYN